MKAVVEYRLPVRWCHSRARARLRNRIDRRACFFATSTILRSSIIGHQPSTINHHNKKTIQPRAESTAYNTIHYAIIFHVDTAPLYNRSRYSLLRRLFRFLTIRLLLLLHPPTIVITTTRQCPAVFLCLVVCQSARSNNNVKRRLVYTHAL